MADLPHSWPGYIQTEDTQFKAAVSENLAQKLGQALNFIYDKQFTTIDFTANNSWTCPDGVTKIIAYGYGGGAGGNAYGLAGENLSRAIYPRHSAQSSVLFLTVVPGTTYDILIGSGGSGASSSNAGFVAGSNGGNTIFKIQGGATISTWYGGGSFQNNVVSISALTNEYPGYSSPNYLNGNTATDSFSAKTVIGYGGLSGPGGAGGSGAARNSSGGTATASNASSNSGAAGGSAVANSNAATAVGGAGGSGFLSLAYLV